MNQCQPSLLSHICISRSPTRFPTKAQQIGRHFHPTGPCPNCSLSNYLCNEIRRASVVLAGDLTFTWSGHQTDSQSWCQQDCQRGLRVALETCPPIDCVTDCIVGWSIYKLGNSSHVVHYGLTWKVGISTVFKRTLTIPCTDLTAGKCLPLGLCKETVEEFTKVWKIVLKCRVLWSGAPRTHHLPLAQHFGLTFCQNNNIPWEPLLYYWSPLCRNHLITFIAHRLNNTMYRCFLCHTHQQLIGEILDDRGNGTRLHWQYIPWFINTWFLYYVVIWS